MKRALLALAACGSSSAPAEEPRHDDRCVTAMNGIRLGGAFAAVLLAPDGLAKLPPLMTRRCIEDGWSAAATDCIQRASAARRDDGPVAVDPAPTADPCFERHLTAAQRERLSRAVATIAQSQQRFVELAPEAVSLAAELHVRAIEPDRGDASGGTYVVIRGERFLSDGARRAKVYFGGRQGSVVRFASDTELVVQAPGGAPGAPVDVLVVFDPGGTHTLPGAFTFVQPGP